MVFNSSRYDGYKYRNNNNSYAYNQRSNKKHFLPADDIGNRIFHDNKRDVIDDNIGNNFIGAPSHLKSSVLDDLNLYNKNIYNYKIKNLKKNHTDKVLNKKYEINKNKNSNKSPEVSFYLQKIINLLKRLDVKKNYLLDRDFLQDKSDIAGKLVKSLLKKIGYGSFLKFKCLNDDNFYGICIYINDEDDKESEFFFNESSLLFALNHLLSKMINFNEKIFTHVVLIIKKDIDNFESLLKPKL